MSVNMQSCEHQSSVKEKTSNAMKSVITLTAVDLSVCGDKVDSLEQAHFTADEARVTNVHVRNDTTEFMDSPYRSLRNISMLALSVTILTQAYMLMITVGAHMEAQYFVCNPCISTILSMHPVYMMFSC